MRVYEIQSHRNGVAGNSFYILRFDGRRYGGDRNMVAVVFPDHGNVAVLSLNKLSENNIKFGENSWRGDEFEKDLRTAIWKHKGEPILGAVVTI